MHDFEIHNEAVEKCYAMAKKSYDEGGVPIGSVLMRGRDLVATGHNQRVQLGDPIAHGEMDCLRSAGRQKTYRDTVLYTSLSPCMMCSGTIVQFKIPHVVILDSINYGGNEDFLRSRGVKVHIYNNNNLIMLMQKFTIDNNELWNEDISE
jgi:cytosine/creatinine deaminase